MALTRQEISARFYRNRKENGLCPRCGKVLDREGHYCQECLLKVREENRKARAFAKSMGFCPECRKEKLFGDEKMCITCRIKKEKYKKPLPEEKRIAQNKAFREKQKALYHQRIEQGLCGTCGKRKKVDGKSRCGICLEKNAEVKRRNQLKKINIKEYRKANGLCYFCGEKVDTNLQSCQKCCDKFSEYRKKSTGHLKCYWRKDNNLAFMKKDRR